MPKKGKKPSRATSTTPASTDEIPIGVIDPFEDEEGNDLADQLLATLDARDAQRTTPTTHTRLRGAGERLINGLRHHHNHHNHHNHNHHHHSSADADANSSADTASITSASADHTRKSNVRKLFGSSPKSPEPASQGVPPKKVSRQQQRKERKAAEVAEMRRQAQHEVALNANQPDPAQIERQGIQAMCAALRVTMHEINPDGHCLYAAVADQLNLRGKVSTMTDYKLTRAATAHEMRTHPDEYKPFISDSDEHMAGIVNKEAGSLHSDDSLQERYFLGYCDAVENTGVWGGQPEILALSRAFKVPIHVVQAGMPVLKVGEGEFEGEPLLISYHRKMYGLGEHYNSLRPAAPAS